MVKGRGRHWRLGMTLSILEGLECQGDCIVWTRGKSKGGYGMTSMIPGGKNHHYLHRVSWQIHNERPIPRGPWVICHRCDNRACINPDHLYLGTAKDNAYDMFRRKRNQIRPPGYSDPNAVKAQITGMLRVALCRLLWDKPFIQEVAEYYGVHERYLRDLITGNYKRTLQTPIQDEDLDAA